MIKIAICDDQKEYRNILSTHLTQLASIFYPFDIYEYASGEAFVEDLGQRHDLVFMDIRLEGNISGYQTAEAMRLVNPNAILIFCTGTETALPADWVSVQASGFLLKQYEHERMRYELSQILKSLGRHSSSMAFSSGRASATFVDLDTVLYFLKVERMVWIKQLKDGPQNYLQISREDQQRMDWSNESLSNIYGKVGQYGFEYANSGQIVNFQHIKKLDSKSLQLTNLEEVDLSRSKAPAFRDRFWTYRIQNKD